MVYVQVAMSWTLHAVRKPYIHTLPFVCTTCSAYTQYRPSPVPNTLSGTLASELGSHPGCSEWQRELHGGGQSDIVGELVWWEHTVGLDDSDTCMEREGSEGHAVGEGSEGYIKEEDLCLAVAPLLGVQ